MYDGLNHVRHESPIIRKPAANVKLDFLTPVETDGIIGAMFAVVLPN
jgi:hypothetical protein